MSDVQENKRNYFRNDFLDRIRVILTVLVILHHTAIMYGADGGWYLRIKASDTLSGILLTLFSAINQSFFMGTFFLLAGYFTPSSFDKKGTARFLLDRLVRLGMPIIVFGFLIGPFTIALATSPKSTSLVTEWWRLVKNFEFNIGPLWFAYALLIFSGSYVLLRSFVKSIKWEMSLSSLRHRNVFLLAVVWGIGAFLLRLWVPTGQELGRLQIGYFSSYILLFFIGCAAAKTQLLEKIEGKIALPWAWISVLTVPSLFIYAAMSGAFDGAPFELHGGWTLPVAAYAFWEPFVACGIILMLFWRCRVSFNPWKFWMRFAPLSYAAFIVHPPIVVWLGVSFASWQHQSLLMFCVIGALSVVFSFVVAALLIKLPGARRIL